MLFRSSEQKNGCKISNQDLMIGASATVSTIKSAYSNAVIKNLSGASISDTDSVGTGYTVTIDGRTYEIVKMGDIDGDGVIDTLDSVKALRHYVGSSCLDGPYIKAADVNNDGEVDTLDSLKILRNYLGTEEINID